MIRRFRRYPVFLLIIGLTAAFVQAGDKHPFTAKDWAAMRAAQAVAVSPDGETILYQVGTGAEKGPSRNEWHMIGADGSKDRMLTLPEGFTPSGFMKNGTSLYGMMKVNRRSQLAVVPLETGKPTVIISLESGVIGAKISPDGTRFALLADPRPADPLAGTRTVVTNDERSLYVVNADGSNGSWWGPALKDIGSLAWSPDGTKIAVLSQTPKFGHLNVRSYIDICTGSGTRRVAEIPNVAEDIAWSSGGEELAFVSTTTEVLTPDHVWTVPVSGGAPRDRTPGLAGSVRGLIADSGGSLWVSVNRGVRQEIDSFRDGVLETAYVWPDGCVRGMPAVQEFAGGPQRLAFSVADPEHWSNVAVVRGGALVKITHEGDDALASVALGPVRVVDWTAKDGTKLQAIATFPAGYEEGWRYPFLVLPHGGPESNDSLTLDVFARFIAGLGYVVMQPQYRGSTGYGSEFLNSIYRHFGDRAYSDVESATDFAIARGWADPKRLAIFGWSAGGFMTSWTVTQTGRYRAAVEGAGITDWLSFIPTSDVMQKDYDRSLPENGAEPLLRFSAVMHADKVTTPLLILHGAEDFRVPVLQGLEFFTLLAERGKTVRMISYPGAPHFPVLWEQKINVFDEIAAWLAEHNK